MLQHVPMGCTSLTQTCSACTAATWGAARKGTTEQFPLFYLSVLFHISKPWLQSGLEGCSYFLWDVRRATGILPKLPVAGCFHSPLTRAIVSAPTCLKFLRDTDIFQWCFNNSLIIAPDNNLHCIETSPVGGVGRRVALVTRKKKIIWQIETRKHTSWSVCSLLRNPWETVTRAQKQSHSGQNV